MMRQATWNQLNQQALVRAISRAYEQLGFRLTKAKLGQTVPVVGVAINAGLSANMTDQTFRRAEAVYRLRFLSEKYGIDPQEWLRSPKSAAPTDPEDDAVDVMEFLNEERGHDDEQD